MLSAALQAPPGLPSVANTAQKTRFNCKIFGTIFGTQNPVKNGPFQTGPPQLQLQLVRLYTQQVESECVFWALPLSSCI